MILTRLKYFHKVNRKFIYIIILTLNILGLFYLFRNSSFTSSLSYHNSSSSGIYPSNIYNSNNLNLNYFDAKSASNFLHVVIEDISTIKCYSESACKVPKGYQRILPPINYYEKSSSNTLKSATMSNEYLIIKYNPSKEVSKLLIDLSFEPFSSDDTEDDEIEVKELPLNNNKYTLFAKFHIGKKISSDTVIIHTLDLLFGTDELHDERPYFQSIHPPNLDNKNHDDIEKRTESSEKDQKEEIAVDKENYIQSSQFIYTQDSKFKIMQLSDLHFGQNSGRLKCLDCEPPILSSDQKTLEFIDHSIEQENPQIVVITGDLLDLSRSLDYKSIILKSLQPILKRGIKFIYTFGDEFEGIKDGEAVTRSKTSIVEFLRSIPGCFNIINHENIHGLTNYNIKIVKDEKEVGYITTLDSEDQVLKDNQINYLYRVNQKSAVNNHIFKLLFFHYPIPQFRPLGQFKIIGEYNEKHPLNSKTSQKFHNDIVNCGYHVISVGHEHENDACIQSDFSKDQSIWLCYNAVTGDSGVTSLNNDYDRKLRIFELDFDLLRLLSWKRDEKGKNAFDHQLIHQF
ncbi:Metallo-dependent phosphatase-like protein [Scheffersomyces amazonensis]|uniref:Metallo-dependent phosphatase-like protein n=1 Tax=Scheffersomyces amazonensis TaxID=1078765 RepID=UPI00315D3E98